MTAVETPSAPSTAPRATATSIRSTRKRYWEDTVHEAIAELRQRLGSNRETVSTQALLTIIEVEKHKMRHGRPVSGTETSHVREDEDPFPLPKLAPLDEPVVAHSATERSERSASGPVPQLTTTDAEPAATDTAKPVAHLSGSDRPAHDPTAGSICNFRPTDDRIPERRPTRAEERRRTERDRAAYIRCYGRYPEDDFPNNPDYHRFRKEARPHKSFLLYLCRKYGTGDDTLPLGTEEDTPPPHQPSRSARGDRSPNRRRPPGPLVRPAPPAHNDRTRRSPYRPAPTPRCPMPFELRCPSCQAKLRLAEAPERGTPVVCPKCDSAFAAPKMSAAKPADDEDDAPPEPKKKKSKGGEDTKPATGDKVVAKERVHMNEFALLGIVGGGMATLILVLVLILWYLGKAARVEDMVAMLPTECNVVRGVNYAQMKKYEHGYKGEVTKHYAGDVQATVEELGKTIGGTDEWLNYFLIGRQLAGGETRVLLLNAKKPFDKAALATALKGTAGTEGGEPFWQLPASPSPGYLRGAVMYCPNDTNILLIRGGNARTLLRSAVAFKTDKKEDRLNNKFGAAGKLAFRGHIWQVLRPLGDTKDYITAQTAPVAKDSGLGKVSDTGKKAGGLGLWITIGGRGVRVGAALDCGDAESASSLVKAMQEGPLGKGDESEIPNGMKAAVSNSTSPEFKEFLQNLSFRSKGEAAYLLSKMETGPEKARSILDMFNKDVLTGGGGGMPGMPAGPGS